ncbi:MAG: 23S rRNA (pseudouridine(1915)-N(3))-methyltransferase RlmH [Clostridia bacterium]|nr:23S rRNA (pseudouridine(1915)-N(3))-methyltransferase RlmH [Clostridia bacterium]
MLKIKFIVMGALGERHWKDACDEYKKRMGASFQVDEIQLKEVQTPKNASEKDIANALDAEAAKILENVSQRSCLVAMCVEGKQLSSPQLASFIDEKATSGVSEICFVIGSSHGLSDKIKKAAALKLSMSALTFPHQLARVMLYEAVYRAGEIIKGSHYHK